jgi:hypothetical protein
MGWSGAGVFSSTTAGIPVITGTTISSTVQNNWQQEIDTGLSLCITKDGQQTTTARIPFTLGVGLGNGTVAAPAVNFTNDIGCGFYRIGSADIGFAISGTKVWDIIAASLTMSQDLLFTDATYDIGKTGATRPRDLFMSRNLTVGGTTAITGHVTVEGVTSTGATGTGKFVFDTSPTLVTPTLGVATGTRLGLGAAADANNILQGPNGSILNSSGAFVNAYVGPHAIGGAVDTTVQWYQRGSFQGVAPNSIYGLVVGPALVEGGSGVHPEEFFVSIVGSITNGAATATDAGSLEIKTFAAATGTTNATGLRVAAPTGGTTLNDVAKFLKSDGSTIVAQFKGSGAVLMPSLATSSGNQTDSVCLDTNGQLIADTQIGGCIVSSLQYKDLVAEITSAEALRIVRDSEPGWFLYKDGRDTVPRAGFAAEAMAQLDPRLVGYYEGKPQKVDYMRYTAVLTKTVQSLIGEIKVLESRVDTLRKQVNA